MMIGPQMGHRLTDPQSSQLQIDKVEYIHKPKTIICPRVAALYLEPYLSNNRDHNKKPKEVGKHSTDLLIGRIVVK